MARSSPIDTPDRTDGALVSLYGPPDTGVPVVQAYDHYELEYAALRKGAGVIDRPQRGLIEVTGDDRTQFLHRMLTDDVVSLSPPASTRAFWLGRKGRITADLLVVALEGRVLLDLDVHAVAPTIESLDAFIIADDVELTDRSDELHRLSLLGPASLELFADRTGAPPDLADTGVINVQIAGADLLAIRQDTIGAPGLELIMQASDASSVRDALTSEPNAARLVGWAAYNTARVESGWPLFMIDFGPDSLPHETGVLYDRVNFKKGCYPGQEVVARMESLGRPKQRLVSLTPNSQIEEARQPDAGAEITTGEGDDAKTIGAVTSSVVSPMLSSRPVALAMVREAHSAPGGTLRIEGADWTVCDNLAAWDAARVH